MAQKIFVFGGDDGLMDMKSAEVYDIAQGVWENLPDMPYEDSNITCRTL